MGRTMKTRKRKLCHRYLVEKDSDDEDYEDDPTLESEDDSRLDNELNVLDAKTFPCHLKTLQPFIMDQFRQIRRRRSRRALCKQIWDRLVDSHWQQNHEIAFCALSCGLDPLLLTKMDCDFWVKAMAVENLTGNQLWEAAGRLKKRNSKVTLKALELEIIDLTQVPLNMLKKKDFLVAGLEQNLFEWDDLSTEAKGHADLAIAASSQPCQRRPDFWKMLSTVKDKDLLWKYWAQTKAERLPPCDWMDCPVVSDHQSMLSVIQQHPTTALYSSFSLATTAEFVHQAIHRNAECLAYFPQCTFEYFPEIVSKEHVAAYFYAGGCPIDFKYHIPKELWLEKGFTVPPEPDILSDSYPWSLFSSDDESPKE